MFHDAYLHFKKLIFSVLTLKQSFYSTHYFAVFACLWDTYSTTCCCSHLILDILAFSTNAQAGLPNVRDKQAYLRSLVLSSAISSLRCELNQMVHVDI